MSEPYHTEAAKMPHTCGLVDNILVVQMVKVASDLLFRDQPVNVGLGTVYSCIFQVHVRAHLLQ